MVTNKSSQLPETNNNGHYVPEQTYLPPVIPAVVEEDEDEIDLSQIGTIVRRRWPLILGVALIVGVGVGARTLTQEPVYSGNFQLLLGSVSGQPSLPEELQLLQGNFSNTQEDFDTRIEVLKSAQVLTPILQAIQARYPDLTYRELAGNENKNPLSIARLRETTILTVNYESSDPEEIKYVLDQIASGYISFSINEQRVGSQQGLQFAQEQLPELEERVDLLQGQLEQFRQQYNLIDPQVQSESVANQLSKISEERQQAQIQLGEAQTLYQTLAGQLGLDLNQAVTISALSQAPRYQALLNRLQEVETKLATETTRFSSNSPEVLALEEERQNLIPLLNQEAVAVLGTDQVLGTNSVMAASPNEIRSDITQQLINTTNNILTLNVRQQALGSAETQMRQQVQNMATVIRQYTDLERDLTLSTESLNRFLSVEQELQLQEAQKEQPWQVISDIRVPETPVSPSIPRDMTLGILAGLLLGAGAAAVAEQLDNTFHSPEELKDATGLPLLGVIPFVKDFKEKSETESQTVSTVGFGRYRASIFTEAFRSLHTNLHFMSPDKQLNSIVVTSSVPAEGKSTVSVNLARTAAAMGQRVLLVDVDLRKPQIHKRMDLPNVWGLSNIISANLSPKEVIQQSPNDQNLYVLTSGQIPPDPTSLISSEKMKSLMQEFRESFDLVVYDTPPTLGMADARIVGAHTDGMLMVVGLSKTERIVLKSTIEGIRLSPAKLLGTVANGVKRSSQSNSSYYYQSYYTTEK